MSHIHVFLLPISKQVNFNEKNMFYYLQKNMIKFLNSGTLYAVIIWILNWDRDSWKEIPLLYLYMNLVLSSTTIWSFWQKYISRSRSQKYGGKCLMKSTQNFNSKQNKLLEQQWDVICWYTKYSKYTGLPWEIFIVIQIK
jgi:hypothetical protein